MHKYFKPSLATLFASVLCTSVFAIPGSAVNVNPNATRAVIVDNYALDADFMNMKTMVEGATGRVQAVAAPTQTAADYANAKAAEVRARKGFTGDAGSRGSNGRNGSNGVNGSDQGYLCAFPNAVNSTASCPAGFIGTGAVTSYTWDGRGTCVNGVLSGAGYIANVVSASTCTLVIEDAKADPKGKHLLFQPTAGNGESAHEGNLALAGTRHDIMDNYYYIPMNNSFSVNPDAIATLASYSINTAILMADELLKLNISTSVFGNDLLSYTDDQISSAYDRVNLIPSSSVVSKGAKYLTFIMPPYLVDVNNNVLQNKPDISIIRGLLVSIFTQVELPYEQP